MAKEMNVTFLMMPDRITHGITLTPSMQIKTVKKHLERALRFPASTLTLTFNGLLLADALTLEELQVVPNFPEDQIVIEVRASERKDREDYKMPETFDVVIYAESGESYPRKVRINVQKATDRKLYLGGYRNKKTGQIYHHASTQTARRPRRDWESRPVRFHRDTQTHVRKSRSTQSMRETGTQMKRKDLYVDETRDKVIVAGEYFSSEMLDALREEKTLVLQCHWRQYKARCAAHAKRDAIAAKKRSAEEARKEGRKREEELHRADIERRLHPHSSADFELLYNDLKRWHAQETSRIHQDPSIDAVQRRKKMSQLLRRELQMLQQIDRLKISARKEKSETRTKKMLELMAAPKRWEMVDGEVTKVHTPFTTRARELYELYSGLGSKLSMRDRLDVLLHVKWTVKEFDCNLTREIVELADREADLLRRQRSVKTLRGLRERLRSRFLQFIETPEFNPEAARFQRVPKDIMKEPSRRPIPSWMAPQSK